MTRFATLLAIIALIGFGMFSSILLITYPPPWPDEALFAEPAMNLLRHGHLGTTLMEGYLPKIATKTYWMPPLYFLYLTIPFSLFGPTLIVMRLASVGVALVLMGLVWHLGRRLTLRHGGWIALALLATTPLFLRGALVGRMDLLALTLMLAAVVLTLRRQQSPWSNFFAGTCSGLAVMAHPFGIVAPLTLGLIGLFRALRFRCEHQFQYFLYGGLLVLLGYALYVFPHFDAFLAQMGGQFARKAARVPLQNVNNGLATIKHGFDIARWSNIAFFSLGSLGLIVGAFRSPAWRILLAMQCTSLLLYLWSQEMWYPVYLLPVAALGWGAWVERLPRLGFLATVILMGIHIHQLGERSCQALDTPSALAYAAWSERISEALPPQSRVVVASIPDPTLHLLRRDDLTVRHFSPVPVDAAQYAGELRKADYIVLGRKRIAPEVERFADRHGEIVALIGDEAPGAPLVRIYRMARR
ncbi:MAG: glycosyltransferase family 39 protein [Deltaproteobacteria bacterium]|nr:glycosyltransferase family 39 protein [Deltaproteobacteria bacterium]